MAYKFFSALPVGFVILFSELRVVDVAEKGNLQSKYQVGITGGKVLLTHIREASTRSNTDREPPCQQESQTEIGSSGLSDEAEYVRG